MWGFGCFSELLLVFRLRALRFMEFNLFYNFREWMCLYLCGEDDLSRACHQMESLQTRAKLSQRSLFGSWIVCKWKLSLNEVSLYRCIKAKVWCYALKITNRSKTNVGIELSNLSQLTSSETCDNTTAVLVRFSITSVCFTGHLWLFKWHQVKHYNNNLSLPI